MPFALILMLLFIAPAQADTPNAKAAREAMDYLGTCTFADEGKRGLCEWEKKEFSVNYLKAKSGEMIAQKNVSFMLSPDTRRDPLPSVTLNPIQSCAWMFVVVASGHAAAGELERDVMKMRCGRLDPTSQGMARARAAVLLKEIASAPTRPPPEPKQKTFKGPLDGSLPPMPDGPHPR